VEISKSEVGTADLVLFSIFAGLLRTKCIQTLKYKLCKFSASAYVLNTLVFVLKTGITWYKDK
jgi:hypothetical protein